jgi:hypothetical protein
LVASGGRILRDEISGTCAILGEISLYANYFAIRDDASGFLAEL